MAFIFDELGDVIRFHRKRARLTQVELASLSGVGKTVIFDIEKGKRTVRFETLMRVLHALNIELEWASPLKGLYASNKEQMTHAKARRS